MKNRDVGGFAGSEFAILAQDPGWAGSEEFDHAH